MLWSWFYTSLQSLQGLFKGHKSASLVDPVVKNLPEMQEMREEPWVLTLGQGDPLEKEMATHSSILAWRIPWTEEPGRLQTTGLQKSQTWFIN